MKALQQIFRAHAPSLELPSLLDDPEDFHRRRVLAVHMMSPLNVGLARLGRRANPFHCRADPDNVKFTFRLLVTGKSLGTLVLNS